MLCSDSSMALVSSWMDNPAGHFQCGIKYGCNLTSMVCGRWSLATNQVKYLWAHFERVVINMNLHLNCVSQCQMKLPRRLDFAYRHSLIANDPVPIHESA